MIVSTECRSCNGTGEVIGATPSVRSRYVRRDDLDPGDFAETCRNCGGAGVADYDVEDEIEDWMPETTTPAPTPADRESAERETHWLIERRVQPPQWSIDSQPTGIGSFYSDVHRAHRFPTQKAASEAMRLMNVTPEERAQYFVSEHIWMGQRAYFGMDEEEFEDFLSDTITDSLDMDWNSRDGAKAIIRALSAHRLQAEARMSRMPRLTEAMIVAAAKGHYGKAVVDRLGIDGIDLTSDDVNWSFREGFKRMWNGARAALNDGGGNG